MAVLGKGRGICDVGISSLSVEDEEERDADSSVGRFVRYQFTPAFLKLKTVGAT